MHSFGEFIKNKIIITKSKDIGRLYNRSHFGKIISNNQLELNLIEAIYLSSESKIRIFDKKKELTLKDLVRIAAKQIPDFEIKYLVYKDLRNRGHPIRINEDKEFFDLYRFNKKNEKQQNNDQFFVKTFSERHYLDFEKTNNLIKTIQKKNATLWFAIVDEEGDITYYLVSSFNERGKIGKFSYQKCIGNLLSNHIIIFDNKISEDLHRKEFFGKPFGDGLQISFIEAWYLFEKDILNIETTNGDKINKKQMKDIFQQLQPDIEARFTVYNDLKNRRFIVKTGYKYGAHFRVYTKQIGMAHADYLVHAIEEEFKGTWADMSRAVRLAHSVNKEFVFAKINRKSIDYIKLGRLRP
jgi:tRNA-intron endonuclease